MLSNCVGKLADKSIANMLQNRSHFFNGLQYGSQKSRSAIDAMMLTCALAEGATQLG